MDIAIRAGQLLLSLSILIVLHELGHFLAARYFGTRVEKFYLFFDAGFSLFKKKIGETEYGIGWLPLGGYVKISGMIDESMDKEQMKGEPQPWEFRTKPAWQRLIIMLGGIIVNVVVGFFIYTMLLFMNGETVLPNENLTDGVMVQSDLAKELGFQNGDKILTVDGNEVPLFGGLMQEIIYAKEVVVDRDGTHVSIDIPEDVSGQLSQNDRGTSFFFPRFPFIIGKIPSESINAGGALAPRDTIIAINNAPVKYFDQGSTILKNLKGQDITAKVKRDGDVLDIPLKVNENGKIGVQIFSVSPSDMAKAGLYEFTTKEYTFFQSIPAGWNKMVKTIKDYLRQFTLIFNPSTGAWKGLGGFGAIAGLFPTAWDWSVFWERTALISLILAVMNLLPIPALDGGHVMFLLYEMVTGREPGQKFLEYAQVAGFVFLMALMLFANGNDIYRWLTGG